MKKYSPLSILVIVLAHTPSPLEQCGAVDEALGFILSIYLRFPQFLGAWRVPLKGI